MDFFVSLHCNQKHSKYMEELKNKILVYIDTLDWFVNGSIKQINYDLFDELVCLLADAISSDLDKVELKGLISNCLDLYCNANKIPTYRNEFQYLNFSSIISLSNVSKELSDFAKSNVIVLAETNNDITIAVERMRFTINKIGKLDTDSRYVWIEKNTCSNFSDWEDKLKDCYLDECFIVEDSVKCMDGITDTFSLQIEDSNLIVKAHFVYPKLREVFADSKLIDSALYYERELDGDVSLCDVLEGFHSAIDIAVPFVEGFFFSGIAVLVIDDVVNG